MVDSYTWDTIRVVIASVLFVCAIVTAAYILAYNSSKNFELEKERQQDMLKSGCIPETTNKDTGLVVLWKNCQ